MNFATNLQFLRKSKNMSQEQLAEQLDVTRQSVSKWESGASYPEMDKLISICKIFKVDMDTLVNGDVSKEKETKVKDASINTKDILDKFNTLMKKFVYCFENMNLKEIIGFIITIICLAIIILLGRIPVELIESLIGENLLYGIGYIGPTLNSLFSIILDILYSVFAIAIFIYALKIKYLDRIKIKDIDEQEIIIKEKEKKIEEETKEVIIKREKDNSFTSLLAKIVIYIIKFFIVMYLFCPLFILIFLAVALGFLVILTIKGIPLLGIILFVVSAIMIAAICFEVPLNFVINHKTSYKRIMITLLASFIIFLVGSIIFAYNFSSITYINDIPKEAKRKTITEVYDMNDSLNTLGNYYDVEYIKDDNLTDKVEVTVEYYNYIVEKNMTLDIHNNDLVIYSNGPRKFSFKEVLDIISKDLKDNTIYNYDKLYNFKVIIKTSSNNINKIKGNNQNYYN